jgi:signal transduction histidine kinase
MTEPFPASGLSNMRLRAQTHHGDLTISAGPTHLHWTARVVAGPGAPRS